MSIIQKLRLALRANKIVEVIDDEAKEIAEAKKKSGWRSTEFCMTLLASLGAVAASSVGILPPVWAAAVASLSTLSYTLSRGLAKQTDPAGGEKPGWKTTELWMGLLSDLGGLLAAAGGLVPPDAASIMAPLSRASYSVPRGMAKQEPINPLKP